MPKISGGVVLLSCGPTRSYPKSGGVWGENLGRSTVHIRMKVFRYELPFVRLGVIGAWRNWTKKSAVARKPPRALDPVQDCFASPLHYDLSFFEMVD
jgi:hypothetical protein